MEATNISANIVKNHKVIKVNNLSMSSFGGKVYADEWSKQLSSWMFNVVHRHITFTIPSEMWMHFEQHPERRVVMFAAVNATLGKVMKGEPGIAIVAPLWEGFEGKLPPTRFGDGRRSG